MKSLIKNRNRIKQVLDFTGVQNKKMHPSDIDAVLEFNDEALILMEVKYKYNKKRHQFKNSECGVYSINFIENMLEGKTFNQYCNSNIPDDKMNKLRKKYYLRA